MTHDTSPSSSPRESVPKKPENGSLSGTESSHIGSTDHSDVDSAFPLSGKCTEKAGKRFTFPADRLRIGLIGYPIGHSQSPALFREYFADRPDILQHWSYDLIERDSFPDAYAAFLRDYVAVNVTTPFKEEARRRHSVPRTPGTIPPCAVRHPTSWSRPPYGIHVPRSRLKMPLYDRSGAALRGLMERNNQRQETFPTRKVHFESWRTTLTLRLYWRY